MATRRGGCFRTRSSTAAHRNRRRLQRHAEALSRQIVLLLIIGTTIAMTMVTACLLAIGPPPTVRMDALWVRQHEFLVRVVMMAVAVAALCSAPLLVSRRNRILAVMMWLVFVAMCIVLFSDRILVIQRVLWHYAA